MKQKSFESGISANIKHQIAASIVWMLYGVLAANSKYGKAQAVTSRECKPYFGRRCWFTLLAPAADLTVQ